MAERIALGRVTKIHARRRWASPSGGTLLMAWSNDPDEAGDSLVRIAHGAAVGVAGYISNLGGLSKGGFPVGESLAQASGVWAVFSASDSQITGSTSITRVEPVYWAEDRDHYYISSNPLLLHLTVRGDDRVDYDLTHIPGFLNAEFPVGDGTPFRGVRAVANATTLAADGRRITEAPVVEDSPGVAESRLVAPKLADALVEAVLPLKGLHVEAALTGGKDSRLVVAALHSAGIEMTVQTYGAKDHPDVLIAASIAELLGISHAVRSPVTSDSAGRKTVSVDLRNRVHENLQTCHGMLSAYENVGRPGDFASSVFHLGGHGGELLRGGYAHFAGGVGADQAVQYLRRLMAARMHVLEKGIAEDYMTFVDGWLSRAASEPASSLDDFYLRYRAGRWSAVARSSYSLRRSVLQPLFDHSVVQTARSTAPADRSNERLIHDVLEVLDPRLVDVPFFGSRWVFENAGPSDSGLMRAWQARTPLTLQTDSPAAFNWRIHYDEPLMEAFRNQILEDDRGAVLFDVVDRAVTESLLSEPAPGPAKLIWSLYTMSYLLSDRWLETLPDPSPVEVSVP